ncbi:RNA polymerase subunit sigma-24 [Nocardioides sp. Root140]|nr:RNA polymerase subunit sigma-24 [Nocardioides sp. Root140]
MSGLDEQLKLLGPQVLGVLVRRGADFAAAEDAVQEALLAAVERWPAEAPAEPKGWLITVAWRKYVDMVRSADARRRREERFHDEPEPGETENADDTLQLLFLCCHPDLSPTAAIALTLRAVGGLTTRQIALAHLVPEATMAQRISRAKRTVSDRRLTRLGDLGRVLKVLYLVFNEGYGGEVDLAAEAIRLTRQLARAADDPEVAGLLALMLLHDARRTSRRGSDGSLIALADQDRSLWDTTLIAEGVEILQTALAKDRLGEYQAQAAIAALHADAPEADETDWPQVLEWYDELLRLTDSPVVALNRVVALGEVDGPLVALRALDELPADLPRLVAVRAHLTERAGSLEHAAELYADAAHLATSTAERDHLTRQAARLRQGLAG